MTSEKNPTSIEPSAGDAEVTDITTPGRGRHPSERFQKGEFDPEAVERVAQQLAEIPDNVIEGNFSGSPLPQEGTPPAEAPPEPPVQ